MRVVQFTEYGPPEVLHVEEVPTPLPGAGEGRIRIIAAAVNPADPKWRQGMFQSFAPVPMPHVVGYDIAGVVDAIGDGVGCNISVGDPVVVMLDGFQMGGYAEYALAPLTSLVRVPDALELVIAAAIPTAGLTGMQMVEEHAKVSARDRVLITGSTGAVGRFALFAARLAGAHTTAAVRSSQVDEARRLGADEVLVLGETPWAGKPADVVIDTVGGPQVAELCRNLKEGGAIFTVATTPIAGESLSAEPTFVTVRNDPKRLAELLDDIAGGKLEVPIAQTLPLDRAVEAHRLIEAGGVRGKIILQP